MHPDSSMTATKNFWKELLSYAIIALVFVLPIKMWIAQPFIVNGSSMDETFADGEYLIVDEISYRFKDPQRGDVLVFRYPQDPDKFFIKRLIGLPGEEVSIKSGQVTITNSDRPEGFVLNEPYIHSKTFNNVNTVLGPEEYFVMGDNRIVSSDSRMWGPLPKDDLIGRPVARLYPFNRIDIWPGVVASTTIETTN